MTAVVDLSPLSFWAQTAAQREAGFARLRREAPVAWQDPAESALVAPGDEAPGFWSVVRHADVRAVSRDPATFRSGAGVMLEDGPMELMEAAQSFLVMDAPRHTRIRGLVQRAFGPRQVRRIEDRIAANARAVVDELLEAGPGADFVERCAKPLPLRLISDMLGVPDADREHVVHVADEMVSWNDPDVRAGREPAELLFGGVHAITQVTLAMVAERRARPREDLVSALVEARLDGERLTDHEIASFVVLLSVAGNDTTRHTASHGLRALTEHPEQRALLLEDLEGRLPGAVEELVRWATPVMTFRRTATRDATIGGQAVAAGDHVVLVYAAANRDEAAFGAPARFDVRRDPNPHVGFGGGGPHFCLGASFARTQLRALFGELLRRVPAIEAGTPQPLVGNFVHGVKAIACTW